MSFSLVLGGAAMVACGDDAQPNGSQSAADAAASDAGASMPEAASPEASPRDAASPDVDNGAPSDVYPAPHDPLPTIVSHGGATIAMPQVRPVFFPNDPYEGAIVGLLSKVGNSTYWSAVVGEYHVGPLTSAPPIELTEAAPATLADADIQAWLAGKLDGTHVEFGQPDPSTIYTIYYPASTSVTEYGGSCNAWKGYHSNVSVNGVTVPYAVIANCPPGALTTIQSLTAFSVHEWIEASTNAAPLVDDGAYRGVDDVDVAWTRGLSIDLVPLPELADMCEHVDGTYYAPMDVGYMVPRSWSNAAALAGGDPCVPARPSFPYFNAIAKVDQVTYEQASARGVKVAPGESKTIEVDIFSTATTSGPISVKVGKIWGATIGLSLDRTHGVNGEKLHLTIDVPKQTTPGNQVFYLESTLAERTFRSYGLVVNM